MKLKPVSRILPALLVIGILTLVFNVQPISAVESPYIAVVPETIEDATLTPGTNFTVSIDTDYVGTSEWLDYIWGYQFALSYNPSVINGVEVVNGDLIVGGSAKFMPGPFDNVAGELSLTVGVFSDGGEVTSGPGTLANVTFTVVGEGASTITIDPQSKLVGWNVFEDPPDYDIINAAEQPDQIQHGYFSNIPPIHDVAVIAVTPSPTSVKLGELVNVTVVVENQGTVSETFTVSAYYDSNTIKTETVTNLVAGTNTSLTFTWNTTDVREEIYATDKKEKAYTINATASTVPDETDTEDNTLVSPSKVRVKSQYIAVIPQSTVDPNLGPGNNYTVSIYTDYNGSDVCSWQFELSYNPTVLEGIEVVNGDLITTEENETAEFNAGVFDNTLGKLWQTNAYFYYTEKPIPTTYGPGILANVTFTVVGTGDSDITLVESRTKLTGYNAITEEFYEIVSVLEPYLGHILHGYFRNTVEAVTHDVAILSVTPSNTTVTEGDLVNITVVVENQGTVPETITVAAYYDSINPNWRIATTKTVQNLGAEANASLTFVWNTMDVTAGSHTIWAEAGTVPGETDTNDNTLQSDEMVEVLPLPARAHILFDQTHRTYPIYDYNHWVTTLEIAGYVVDTHTYGTVTSIVLEAYDIFVIPEAYDYYSSAELSAIQNFVFNGGGLLVIGDSRPEIYTELTSFTGISWSYGGSGGITTDITIHEVTQNVASIDMHSPMTEMYVTGAAQGLIRDPYGGIMLAVSEQFGRVVGFADGGTFTDYYILNADNRQLAKNIIDWLTPIQYEHELSVRLDAPYYIEPDLSSRLNATVYNRGLNNETNVELELFINDILVNSTVVAFLPANASYTISYMWTPIDEGAYNVTAYAPPVPNENVTVNNVVTKLVAVTYPLIRPMEGQWANYTLTHTEKGTNTSMILFLNVTYSKYVSTYQMNVTLWIMDSGVDTLWLTLNIMNRRVEAGVWANMRYPLWIETDVTIGSKVGILDTVGTVIGSRFVDLGGLPIDSWELEVPYYYGQNYTYLFDKVTGVLTGVEGENPYFIEHWELTATNILRLLPVEVNPETGTVGTQVAITGAEATPNGTVEIYWDNDFLGTTASDSFGDFSYTFTVPPATSGPHHVSILDVTTRTRGIAAFTVVPSISITPTTGSIGAKVQIAGFGFGASEHVALSFDDMRIAEMLADEYGSFLATFNIPLSEAGLHSIKAWYDLDSVETSFTVVDVTPLEIQMDVGALFFKGETAEFYVQTCFKGVPVDATFINATLCKPDGTIETLVAQRITTGLCKVECLIKGKGSMLGTYMLVIEASYTTSTVDSTGTCIKTFLVKEPYRTLEKEAPKAALVAGSIGTILALAIAWRKRKQLKE